MTDESINPTPEEPVESVSAAAEVPAPPAPPAPAYAPPAPPAPPAPAYAPPAPPAPGGYAPPPAPPVGGYAAAPAGDKQKMVAGILGILLGSLGVHKFYLGYTKEGVIMLVVTLVAGFITFGLASAAMSVIGLVEGIMYLTKTDQEFYQTYVVNQKTWF